MVAIPSALDAGRLAAVSSAKTHSCGRTPSLSACQETAVVDAEQPSDGDLVVPLGDLSRFYGLDRLSAFRGVPREGLPRQGDVVGHRLGDRQGPHPGDLPVPSWAICR
jgi:hypothetical protein